MVMFTPEPQDAGYCIGGGTELCGMLFSVKPGFQGIWWSCDPGPGLLDFSMVSKDSLSELDMVLAAPGVQQQPFSLTVLLSFFK